MRSERAHILLVEDNAADIYLFRKALERAQLDCELTVVEDGGEALAFVQDEGNAARLPPDLAVIDLNIPRHDGIQVLRAVRKNKLLANIPVILTSSSPSLPLPAIIEQLNITRYIPKPLDLEAYLQIGTVVKELLCESRARRSAET